MTHGTALSPLTNSAILGEPWIIDSGASDHMTGIRSFFCDYSPYNGDRMVKLADGSFTPITGFGIVWLITAFYLSNVLHVPKLSYNLLSISKRTADQNCIVNFSPHFCLFQDQLSGWSIGSAKAVSGLYYFMRDLSSNECCHVAAGSKQSSSRHQIMLLHYRLGHPSFSYMHRLFLSLFSNNDTFTCEICLLAKHACVSFPIQNYQPSRPFLLIHSDLWGPSRVTSISNKRWFISFIDDYSHVGFIFYVISQKFLKFLI